MALWEVIQTVELYGWFYEDLKQALDDAIRAFYSQSSMDEAVLKQQLTHELAGISFLCEDSLTILIAMIGDLSFEDFPVDVFKSTLIAVLEAQYRKVEQRDANKTFAEKLQAQPILKAKRDNYFITMPAQVTANLNDKGQLAEAFNGRESLSKNGVKYLDFDSAEIEQALQAIQNQDTSIYDVVDLLRVRNYMRDTLRFDNETLNAMPVVDLLSYEAAVNFALLEVLSANDRELVDINVKMVGSYVHFLQDISCDFQSYLEALGLAAKLSIEAAIQIQHQLTVEQFEAMIKGLQADNAFKEPAKEALSLVKKLHAQLDGADHHTKKQLQLSVPQLTQYLKFVTKAINEPTVQNAAALKVLGDGFLKHSTSRAVPKLVGLGLLIAGIAMIAASAALLAVSYGVGIPVSILGFKIGASLIATAAVVGGVKIAGVVTAVGGYSLFQARKPESLRLLKVETDELAKAVCRSVSG